LDIQVSHMPGGVAIVSPQGRLNMTSAIDLRDTINILIAGGENYLVVDLSGVEFIDSSGLGGLVSGLKRAREAGGDLRLVSPSEQARLVLELTNLDKVLMSFEDIDAAFASWMK
jgi:anti-sigma B factor antagonist